MEFFKTIADILQDSQQMQMTVRKNGSNIAVSILPDGSSVKDKTVENITPLVMSGTPQEFEEGFLEALIPLKEAFCLVSNIKNFEASTEKARKESEMIKKSKDKATKQEKEFSDLIALAKKKKEEHKFKDALSLLEKAQTLPLAKKSVVDKVRKEIEAESGVGNLFSDVEDLSDSKTALLPPTACEGEDFNEGEE